MSGGITQKVFDAKWICNGFPKSGTHLLSMMVRPVAPPTPNPESGLLSAWAGTHAGNSWTGMRMPLEWTCFKSGRVENGHMIKAHLAHDEELERFLYLLGAVHIFIYRDLRDVAVSQAFHIMNSQSDKLLHPNRDKYMKLGSYDNILLAVIEGLDEFPGIIERWEMFSSWLDVDWVLSVKFEDLLNEPKKWAENIFKFAMRRSTNTWSRGDKKLNLEFDEDGMDLLTSTMVEVSQMKKKSPTFRKGITGEWKERFYPIHKEAFIEEDKEKWLVELGYEGEEWYG